MRNNARANLLCLPSHSRSEPCVCTQVQTGAADGISFSYDGKTGNTLRSHRLIEWARTQQGGASAQDRVVEALFKRYFEAEADITSVGGAVGVAHAVCALRCMRCKP